MSKTSDRDDRDDRGGGQARDTGGGDQGRAGSGQPNPIELQRALKGVDYPATRGALVSAARNAQADDTIVDALMRIPERNYEDPAQVSEAVAKHRE